jgi:heme exporter protein C
MISWFANPQRFMALSKWASPLCAGLAVLGFALALPQALGASPADYQMGETVRIMYVHVPAASLSLGLFAAMGVASFVSLVWRHSLADVAARAMAPVGAVLAALCLITGAIWGEPTWGTWWEWGDARLTSMLVLFITYVGYLALWSAVEDEARAAKLAAILCLVGLINLPIVRYSVEWWSTLHQGVNLSPIERAILDPEYSRMCNPESATGPLPEACARPAGDALHPSMRAPLTMMLAAFGLAVAALTMQNMRALIFRRQAQAAELRLARAST